MLDIGHKLADSSHTKMRENGQKIQSCGKFKNKNNSTHKGTLNNNKDTSK